MRKNTSKHFVRDLAQDGLWMAILILLGMLKIPSIFPGAGFQLSAPYAVLLAYHIGFKRYFGIGIGASVIQLLLGTHTIWNVLVSLVFRIVAGLIASKASQHKAALIGAGPLGSAFARLALSFLLHTPFFPLLIAAVPGMTFTAVSVAVMIPIMNRIPRMNQMRRVK